MDKKFENWKKDRISAGVISSTPLKVEENDLEQIVEANESGESSYCAEEED